MSEPLRRGRISRGRKWIALTPLALLIAGILAVGADRTLYNCDSATVQALTIIAESDGVPLSEVSATLLASNYIKVKRKISDTEDRFLCVSPVLKIGRMVTVSYDKDMKITSIMKRY